MVSVWRGTWSSWISINDGIPSFYKNYASLTALRDALTIHEEKFVIPLNGTYTCNFQSYGFIAIVQEYTSRGFGQMLMVNYTNVATIGSVGAISDKITYSISDSKLILTNNDDRALGGTIRFLGVDYQLVA